ncbi:MAG TPA: MarR family transcriptional regulator [Acidimicrobiales bacterium]
MANTGDAQAAGQAATASEDEVDRIIAQWRNERPDLDPSPMGVFGRLARISIARQSLLTKFMAQYDLSPAGFDVLANLRRSGPPHRKTPSELATSSLLSSGGVTFRLDRLEAAGLIRRVPSPTDRRVMYAELTPEGLALIDDVMKIHLEHEHELLVDFSQEERDTLARLLSKLEASLRSSATTDAAGDGRRR